MVVFSEDFCCPRATVWMDFEESDGTCERRGHYNPLVLVAMGATIKESYYALDPKLLMEKCQRIKFLPLHFMRRPLSDILRTRRDDLTAEEKLLFLDVALLYPITNLGDVDFVHVLDRLLKWLETVDPGTPSKNLLKLQKLEDLNASALNDHRKEHELFYNIYMVLGFEGARRVVAGNHISAKPCLSKAIEILTLHKVSIEAKADLDLGSLDRTHGSYYMYLSLTKSRSSDFRGAVEDLLKADTFFPNHAYILQLLGIARSACGQHQEALELLNRAIALYPTTKVGIVFARDHYADAFAIRGDLKRQLHDSEGAKLDMDFARALDPHSSVLALMDARSISSSGK